MNLISNVQWCFRWVPILLGLTFALAACGDKFEVEIDVIPKSEVQAGGEVEISVGVKYPPSGLVYRWSPTRGVCRPQKSSNRFTTYTAPLEPGKERVTLEILKGSKIIYAGDVTITVVEATSESQVAPSAIGDSPSAEAMPEFIPQDEPAIGEPAIHMTLVPPYDEVGGPDSAAVIEGRVLVAADPKNFRVVVYALTDRWYVQPLVAQPYTRIGQDGSWRTWTHTGSVYAALLVKKGFRPQPRTFSLPDVGGDVLAITTVTGKR